MSFLALDTSGDYAVLVLAEDSGVVRACAVFEGRRTLSRRLIGEIDTLLKANGRTIHALSAIAVGLGPGSFTGVRVGVTTAKALAQVIGTPLIGIGTLAAHAAMLTDRNTAPIAVVAPARRGEVYLSVFGVAGRDQEPITVRSDIVPPGLTGAILCGRTETLEDAWTNQVRAVVRQPWTPPDGLAQLAANRLAANSFDDHLALTPLYAAPPAISVPKDRRVLGVPLEENGR